MRNIPDAQKIFELSTIWKEAACSVFVMNRLMFGRRGSSAVYTFEREGRRFDVRPERQDPAGRSMSTKPT